MSRRVAAAGYAQERRSREHRALRVLGGALLLVVVVPSLVARPRAGAHGDGLMVAVALAVLVAAFIVVLVRADQLNRGATSLAPTVAALVAMGAAGVVLSARQPNGTGELALALVAFVAGARLDRRTGLALVVLTTAATAAAVAATAALPLTSIGSTVLLAALLYLLARVNRQAQADRERAELASAALADARERELRSAAVAERAHIAREMHDVLAHSLSGLSLQIEAARLLAEQEDASPRLRDALARCRRIAGDGLEEARRAVRALRGDEVAGLDDLPALVEGFRDAGLDVALTVRGERRPVAAEAGLAVYRAAQEALTNVARHSGAVRADVELDLRGHALRLVVADDGGGPEGAAARLPDAGTGYGLSAMRERAQLLGGRVEAGRAGGGFRVELELPA